MWVYEQFGEKIGVDKARDYLTKIDYGNADPTGDTRTYWIDGNLRITAQEQIQFLKKLLGRSGPSTSTTAAPHDQEPMRLVNVEIIVIHMLDLDPEQLRVRYEAISDLAAEHQGELTFSQSNTALVSFPSRSGPGAALKFKTRLIEKFPTEIKFLYGNTTTHHGIKGNDRRLEFGYIYPGLSEALKVLESMDFGSIQKYEFPDWFTGKDQDQSPS